MKIIGTKIEVETVLSALPGADMFGSNPIPPDGWRAAYQWVPIEIVLDDMNAEGTIPDDVEPVRHGRWKLTNTMDSAEDALYCSQCKYIAWVGHWTSEHRTPYCPNCGAKMSVEN